MTLLISNNPELFFPRQVYLVIKRCCVLNRAELTVEGLKNVNLGNTPSDYFFGLFDSKS